MCVQADMRAESVWWEGRGCERGREVGVRGRGAKMVGGREWVWGSVSGFEV